MLHRLIAKRASKPQDSALKDVLLTFPGVISFAGGLPDEQAFDMELIAEITQSIVGRRASWQYLETEGYLPLREALAEHMGTMGVAATARNILITNGSQQGLDLIAKLLIDPGDRVLIEGPGYLGGLGAFDNYESRLVPIPLDDEGLDLEALERVLEGERGLAREPDAGEMPGSKFLYTVSTFQNPTGATLPLERRRRLLELAKQHGFLIVEDGAYHLLRYDGEPIPPIKSLDQEGTVIYLGSLSKVLVPGIRVGWIAADEEIINRLALLKQATDLAGNTFGQLFAERWLREVGLRPPIDLYRKKRDGAMEALQQLVPEGVRFSRPAGGFFFWLQFPQGIDTHTMLPLAKENGVVYVPGSAFGGAANTIRFSFSQVPLDQIDEGVRRLAATYRQYATKGVRAI